MICLYNPSIFWYQTEIFEIRDCLTHPSTVCDKMLKLHVLNGGKDGKLAG